MSTFTINRKFNGTLGGHKIEAHDVKLRENYFCFVDDGGKILSMVHADLIRTLDVDI